VEAATQELAK